MRENWEPIEFNCRYCGKHVKTRGYVNGRPDKRTVFCCEEHQIKYWKHHYREK